MPRSKRIKRTPVELLAGQSCLACEKVFTTESGYQRHECFSTQYTKKDLSKKNVDRGTAARTAAFLTMDDYAGKRGWDADGWVGNGEGDEDGGDDSSDDDDSEYFNDSNSGYDSAEFSDNYEEDQYDIYDHANDQEHQEIRARWINREDINRELHDATYLDKQDDHLKEMYGEGVESVRSMRDLRALIKRNNPNEKKHNETLFLSMLASFGMECRISRAQGNKLLYLISRARSMHDMKIPKNWRTVTRYTKKMSSSELWYETKVEFPEYFHMENFKEGECPDKVVVRANDVIHKIGMKLVDPEIALTKWNKHLNFKAVEVQTHDANTVEDLRVYSHLMSSVWAGATESEMLKNTEESERRATLLPIILNSDGVALGATNQSINTAMATFGNCDIELINQLCSKVILGYIPKRSYSKDLMLRHLQKNGHSKTQSLLAEFYFDRQIDLTFWNLIAEPIRKANKRGVYLKVLGVPDKVLLFYPYLVAHVGDEPGQKRLCGMKEGNAIKFCIHCEYQSSYGMYSRVRDTARDSTDLIEKCKRGFIIRYNKFNDSENKRISAADNIIINYLDEFGIHPFIHPFHYTPMGVNNSLYKTPYDLLHVFCCGIFKTIMFAIVIIIDRLSLSSDGRWVHVKGLFDSRLRSYASVGKDVLPHVDQTVFANGFMHYVNSKSNSQKGTSSGSTGGHIRSKHFIILLIQTYFAIGDAGDVLPAIKNFN
jgi:Plavaka transposase